jgi:hypothetical protein
LASASSPHFSQYAADSDSSPSIMVEPWEKKCTGVNSGHFCQDGENSAIGESKITDWFSPSCVGSLPTVPDTSELFSTRRRGKRHRLLFLRVDLFRFSQELHVRTQASKCLSTESELPVRPFSLPCYPAIENPLATPAPHTHLSAHQTSRAFGNSVFGSTC